MTDQTVQGPEEFTAVFFNETTGETRTFIFKASEFIQARNWMTLPVKKEEGTELVAWLVDNNENRQAAYCAIMLWKNELREKSAH